jgi:catechol 2,3-dioxygenase-like lactoylglutathione lyase family enzyme
MIVERYSFVALTTTDLERARRFWVDQLGFPVTEEEAGHFFIVDAGTLRLCVDVADGDAHRAGSTDPVIGFKVSSLSETLAGLATRGVHPHRGPLAGHRGSYAELRDPDGRVVIISEVD